MALKDLTLYDLIKDNLTDNCGFNFNSPYIKPTIELLQAISKSYCDYIKTAIVNTIVTGPTASGSPFEGVGVGAITGLTPQGLNALIIAELTGFKLDSPFCKTPELVEAVSHGAITHVLTTIVETDVTGNATSTPLSSGPLATGVGKGNLTALDGSLMAGLMIPKLTSFKLGNEYCVTQQMISEISMAIVEHTMNSAEVTTVVSGVCPAVSGPLSGGVGLGSIS